MEYSLSLLHLGIFAQFEPEYAMSLASRKKLTLRILNTLQSGDLEKNKILDGFIAATSYERTCSLNLLSPPLEC